MRIKKKVWIWLVVFLLLIVGYIIFFRKEKELIIWQENLNFEIKSEIKIKDIIKDSKNCTITNEEEYLNTDQLGEQKIKIRYKQKEKEHETELTIKIVDTESPVINYEKEIEINVGESIDLLKDVKVTDNSGEEIIVKVNGEYDINKEDKYNLQYEAEDSSGNKTVEEFTLIVTKKIIGTNYPKLIVPEGGKEVSKTEKGFTVYEVDGSTYIDSILIANKTYPLKNGYVPTDTYTSADGVTSQCATCINNVAYNAWLDMKRDATALGLNIWIQSGYRPQSLQERLYNDYVARDGKNAADTYSSRPGHSEHQTGLCFDLNSISDAFASTNEGRWVNENAYRYGFIIRFPNGKENETGYKYESWHLRYVGTDLSYKLYNEGNWISLEEYFGITSEYKN